MAEPLKVTVYDPETGETHHTEVPPGQYLLLAVDPCYRAALNAHGNGTHQITLKGVSDAMGGILRTIVADAEANVGDLRRLTPETRARLDEPLVDPDCRDGKHPSCVGGPCECECHQGASRG